MYLVPHVVSIYGGGWAKSRRFGDGDGSRHERRVGAMMRKICDPIKDGRWKINAVVATRATAFFGIIPHHE